MVGRRSTKDLATDEPSEDATTKGQRTGYGFRAVHVFERLSRDLWPSLCALDGIRKRNFRKFPRQQQEHHRSTPLRCATLPYAEAPDAEAPAIGIFGPPIRGSERERLVTVTRWPDNFRCQPRSSLQSVLWLDDYHCCNSAGIINHGSMPASIAQISCDTSARSRSFVLLAYHAR
jgi:hypothetical protein